MGVCVQTCPRCGESSHIGSHDEGYEKTDEVFTENEEIFAPCVLRGHLGCGHVWVDY